jgi:O-antigen ligase
MIPMSVHKAFHRYWPTVLFLLLGLSLVTLLLVGYRLQQQHRFERRGVQQAPLRDLSMPSDNLYGVNVSLQQYATDQDLQQALRLLQSAGFGWLRQQFSWDEIEPQPGEYDWAPWDHIVSATKRQDLQLIAVLDTSPEWARRPADAGNRFAPPQYHSTYGLFVRAFAQRYGEQITCYEIWDQPNIYPHWGEGRIDPAAYVQLLEIAAREIRAVDPSAIVLSAGLAPNNEAGGRNLSEVLFVQQMYQAGAQGLFDVLAAKPYGFWSGPEDRRVDPRVLNFSRLILLREQMVRYGDGQVPIWAAEFGWNSLPDGWQGTPSPWGTDKSGKQADRTLRGALRAREEWAWLGVMSWAELQPDLPTDDPRWGFALLGPTGDPTPFYSTLKQLTATPAARARYDGSAYSLRLGSVVLAVLLLLAALLHLQRSVPWLDWVRSLARAYALAPPWAQWLLPGLCLAAYQFLPGTVPSLLALACAAFCIHSRLDIGLAYLAFSIPFFLSPKPVLSKAFSLVETLTVLCISVWLWTWLREQILQDGLQRAFTRARLSLKSWVFSLTTLDWAAGAFVLVSAMSLLSSYRLGVSLREFRVVIVEPVLLYFLLRQMRWKNGQLLHLVDALLLSGLLVAAIGLYQYLVSGDVIIAEGVRRIRAVYASPNNLSLFLGRIIPLALSVAWIGRPPRRWLYGLAALPLLLCLFLTFSRGGWLLSLPAGLLAIGLMRGRRTAVLMLTVIAVCVLLLLPLLGTQRVFSLFDLQQGTTFRRLKLWQSAVEMIRDHPWTGIGLDNFLYLYPQYMLPEAWEEPGLSHPHNIVLDFWTRLGLGGLIVLVWMEAAFIMQSLRLYRGLPDGDERAMILGLGASMAAALAHGLIDNSYFLVDLAFVFFASLGMVQAMTIRLNHEKAAP